MTSAIVYALDHLQLAMPAGREAEARHFYSELLGLPEIPKPANLAARGGAWFQLGALQLHLGVEADFQPAKKAHPALLTHDLAQLISTLQQAGYTIKEDPEPLAGYDRVFTADPFGNRIELMQVQQAASTT